MMVKTVHVALYDSWSDWEPGFATAHIHSQQQWHLEPGTWQVKYVALDAEPVTSMGGMRVLPDLTLDELSPEDSALLILPGLDLSKPGTVTEPFARKAREFLDKGVPVAAICGGTFVLAREGLLDERTHTSNDPNALAATGYSGGAHYVTDRSAVTDGDLITASGTRPVDFAREIFARVGLYEPQVLDAWYKLYANNDPAGFFTLFEYAQRRSAAG